MASSREERVRFRYGMCLNDGCSKCKTKEVQEIPARKDFVCAECGKPLRECPPPKKGPNMKMIGAAVAAVVVLGGGAAALFMGGGEEKAEEVKAPVELADSQKVDSPAVAAPAEAAPVEAAPEAKKPAEPKQTAPAQPAQKNPSWGKYDGQRDASGLPHGNGVLRITRSTTINGETAQPGERIEGVFRNGYVNMGTWYKNDGNAVVVKGVKVV